MSEKARIKLGSTVYIDRTDLNGLVVGKCTYTDSSTQYWVEYVDNDKDPCKSWFYKRELSLV